MKTRLRLGLAAVLTCAVPLGTAFAGSPTTTIDGDGCETAIGYNQVNHCNAKLWGSNPFYVQHSDINFVGGGSGGSAYVSLYCLLGHHLMLTVLHEGEIGACGINGPNDFALKSVCGINPVCSTK